MYSHSPSRTIFLTRKIELRFDCAEEVDMIVDTAEVVAEVVEQVAEKVEEVTDEIGVRLPGGKLKVAADQRSSQRFDQTCR